MKNALLTLFLSSVCVGLVFADIAEDYGQVPKLRGISISPDGKHYAFIQRMDDGTEVFFVIDAKTQKPVGGANASELKARNVYFASNEHVILTVSKTLSSIRVKGDWEADTAVAYNFRTKKLAGLLVDTDGIYPAQSGLSRIVGANLEKNQVFIPAYYGALSATKPPQHLMRVNLDSGKGRIHARGRRATVDWFVNDVGDVLAREDFNNSKNIHRIYSYTSGKPKIIFEQDTPRPKISIRAINLSGDSLVFVKESKEGEGIYEMALSDGAITGPQFLQPDRDIDSVLTLGLNRQFVGARLSGLKPSYRYLDKNIGKTIDQIIDQFPASSVFPVDATADLSKIIFSVSGNATATAYLLYDGTDQTLAWIGKSYPNIDNEMLGEIRAIQYPARDGTKITAVMTLPTGIDEAEKLPLLVFPHGGPESYDRLTFDWWAQYFARRGYLVFQPNFRGSTGFGAQFRNAGRGQWGQLMQDDITDGVQALVTQGYADPQRICIMGASYGGYAALAGGAFTPELYRCVISVAGVSDVVEMIRDTKYKRGRNHWVVSYWQELIGDSQEERDKLKQISPLNHAEKFEAPVLLVHGKDDVVVPIKQSRKMRSALRKADKSVELVTMKGEDHWLSRSETRLQTLREIDAFLQQHNPPG